MIISTDAKKKAFVKIQCLFMTKMFIKVGKMNSLNLKRGI